jgi:DNA-binding XRE family transcriptional regulator
MHPEEIQVQKHASPEDMRARVANVQLQKDAKELAELCASVPGDMDGVKQGLLSKDLLEKLRPRGDVFQVDMADYLGISQGHLSKIERGKGAPSIETLLLLSERFHKSIDWILRGDWN